MCTNVLFFGKRQEVVVIWCVSNERNNKTYLMLLIMNTTVCRQCTLNIFFLSNKSLINIYFISPYSFAIWHLHRITKYYYELIFSIFFLRKIKGQINIYFINVSGLNIFYTWKTSVSTVLENSGNWKQTRSIFNVKIS